ncbi:MAG: hypothetical protein GY943_19890 [Chloroflexi bacterium]|nr:hypothetical protein [Chloroflexota bacterium]
MFVFDNDKRLLFVLVVLTSLVLSSCSQLSQASNQTLGTAEADILWAAATESAVTSMATVAAHDFDEMQPLIAFISDRNGRQEIFFMKPNGADPVLLASDLGNVTHVDWSPDGSQLVFSSNRGNKDPSNYDLFIIGVNGTGLRQLTATELSKELRPMWSPDGRYIAFHSLYVGDDRGSVLGLLDLEKIGSDAADQLDHPAFIMIASEGRNGVRANKLATWSPDGRQLAYVHDPGSAAERETEIRVVSVHDPSLQKETLLSPERSVYELAWSPDGQFMALVMAHENTSFPRRDIFMMPSAGEETAVFESNFMMKESPHWLPDTQGLLFTSDQGGNKNIYQSNHDGSYIRQVTEHEANDFAAVYRPVLSDMPTPTATPIASAANRTQAVAHAPELDFLSKQ